MKTNSFPPQPQEPEGTAMQKSTEETLAKLSKPALIQVIMDLVETVDRLEILAQWPMVPLIVSYEPKTCPTLCEGGQWQPMKTNSFLAIGREALEFEESLDAMASQESTR